MVENNIQDEGEMKRHFPSRRGNRGRFTPSASQDSAYPQEIIRSLPATSEESEVSQKRWLSPHEVASDRLSAVVAEAKRKEKEQHSQVQADMESDIANDSSVLSSSKTNLIETDKSAGIDNNLNLKEKNSFNDEDTLSLKEVGANVEDISKPESEPLVEITKDTGSYKQDEGNNPIFKDDSAPNTITDTQSALTATQVKAEIRRQKKKRRRRRRLVLTTVLLIIFGMIGGGFYAGIKYSPEFASLFGINQDYQGKGYGEVMITIPKGTNGKQIADILFKNDVIASNESFILAFNKNKYSQGIQAGVYKMAKHMSAEEALGRLLDPKYKADEKLTIPEGFRVTQIKERFKKTAGFKSDQVDAAFTTAIKEFLPSEAKGKLEGWIAPDTYVLQQDDTPEKLLKKMIDAQILRLKKLGVNPDKYEEVLIKASILEREVSKPEDMGKVARVIDNRLKKDGATDGLLQMCSTVVYGLNKEIIIPNDEELKIDTPYNTYMHPGLPPYPISSPGEAALKATLNPTPGDWFYFATVNLQTGETRFAKTKEEHDRNVAQLREYCKKNPKICKKNS